MDGAILSTAASLLILLTMRINPRVWLHDYPRDIQAMVPPKTANERRQSLALGIPFLIVLAAIPLASTLALESHYQGEMPLAPLAFHAFGVAFVFNVVDLLVLDWLLFCTITPPLVVIPGTAGAAGYKDYAFHFRGFLIGTAISAVAGLLIGALVWSI
jgi:hypothetical protein